MWRDMYEKYEKEIEEYNENKKAVRYDSFEVSFCVFCAGMGYIIADKAKIDCCACDGTGRKNK